MHIAPPMRVVFGSIICVILTLSSSLVWAQDSNIPRDKALHFGVAAGAQTGCYAVAKSVTNSKWGSQFGCFALVNLAGAIKELSDPQNGGTRDERDLYANMLGSGLSFALISVAF